MSNDLFAVWMALAPGLSGSLLFFFTITRLYSGQRGELPLILGTGGVAGFLLFSFIVLLLAKVGAPVFQASTSLCVAILPVCIGLVAFRLKSAAVTSPRRTFTGLRLVAGIVILISCGVAAYQHFLLPAQGWDTYDFWAHWARWLIGSSHDPSDFYNYSRHPIGVVVMQAWAGWCANFWGNGRFIFIPWIFIWICIGFMLYGYALLQTGRSLLASIIANCGMSIALLENHALITGYAELLMAAVLLGSVIWVSEGLKYGNRISISIGLLFALSALSVKNTGILYFSAIVIALAVVKIASRRNILGAFSIITIGLIFYALNFGFDILLLGHRLGLIVSENQLILIGGGWKLPLVENSLVQVTKNQVYSLLINQSFSTVFVGATLIAVLSFKSRRLEMRFTILICSLTLFSSFFLQLFTAYGFEHATPESDTGNSRMLLPMIPVMLTLMVSACYRGVLRYQPNVVK